MFFFFLSIYKDQFGFCCVSYVPYPEFDLLLWRVEKTTISVRMEGEEAQHFYGFRAVDLRSVGKTSVEWDLNDWKWDGDLFLATQLNPAASETTGRQFLPLGNSSNSSSSCSDEGNNTNMVEKKRRAVAIQGDSNAAGGLTLKLGDNACHLNAAKKTKFGAAVCQVENCEADLSKVKDYHRRHKVCEMHSKATSAIVGGILQRFCQQCSRYVSFITKPLKM